MSINILLSAIPYIEEKSFKNHLKNRPRHYWYRKVIWSKSKCSLAGVSTEPRYTSLRGSKWLLCFSIAFTLGSKWIMYIGVCVYGVCVYTGWVYIGVCVYGVCVHRGVCIRGVCVYGVGVHRGVCIRGWVYTGCVYIGVCVYGVVYIGVCVYGVCVYGVGVHRGVCIRGGCIRGGCT